MGLVLILMILKPLSDFLETGVSTENILPGARQSTGISNSTAGNYNAIQDEMLHQSINKQAETQIKGYCANEGFKLVSVDVKVSPDYASLQDMYITVKKTDSKNRPFIYVEPRAQEESPEIKRLKNILSEVYNMSLDNIHISETL